MLKHGLQEMHGAKLSIPRSRRLQPSQDGLEERFQAFSEAS